MNEFIIFFESRLLKEERTNVKGNREGSLKPRAQKKGQSGIQTKVCSPPFRIPWGASEEDLTNSGLSNKKIYFLT